MIALIFGGCSGIGLAVADRLDHSGKYVDVITPSSLVVDVQNPYAIAEWFDQRSDWLFSGSDLHVVYSAGVNYLEWIGKMDEIKVSEVLDVNLRGFILVLNALKSHAPEDHTVRVVSISSDAATRPMRTSIAYCASKAGQEMAMRVAARELGSDRWAINSVAPGMTEGTGMTTYVDARVPEVRGWTPEYAAEYEQQQAVHGSRVFRDDIAITVEKVLDLPMIVNGATFTVNGGRS